MLEGSDFWGSEGAMTPQELEGLGDEAPQVWGYGGGKVTMNCCYFGWVWRKWTLTRI